MELRCPQVDYGKDLIYPEKGEVAVLVLLQIAKQVVQNLQE
jgi:hypothetical protein